MTTPKQISLPLHLSDETRQLVTQIRAVLGAVDTYAVGGFVRDLLRRRDARDIDLAVSGDALALARRLADALGGSFVPLGEAWGVARVVLSRNDRPWVIDIGRLRGDLFQDLAERDFTINAIAVPLPTLLAEPHIIDPFAGLSDLERRTIRMVRPDNFDADPLRLLRAVRLAVELNFEIESATQEAIHVRAGRVTEPAAERCRDELVRLLEMERAARGLRLLDTLGLLDPLFPELVPTKTCEQPTKHYWGVFDHLVETVAVLDVLFGKEPPPYPWPVELRRVFWEEVGWWPDLRTRYEADFGDGASRLAFLKLGAFLHDVAKPQTKAVDAKGRIRFIGHAELGARRAEEILRRFRFSNQAIRLVATLVKEHLRPSQLSHRGEPPTRRALYRFFRDTGDAALDILILALADMASARGPRLHPRYWRYRVLYVRHIMQWRLEEETAVKPQRLVTGHDLMAAFGLQPGPLIGRLLAAIEEAQGAGEIRTREEALALADRLLEQRGRELRAVS